MQRLIPIICFFTPLVISSLNIQGLISAFVSETLSQVIAYLNLVLIIAGIFLYKNHFKTLSKTNRLWFIFYFLYYSFGLLALGVNGFEVSVIATLVPVIFFIGFFFLMSNEVQFRNYFKVATVCFVISSFVTIILIKLNINPYTGDVHGWALDRAGGITGDPNAAAHTAIFAFILFNHLYKPQKTINKLFKFIVLSIIFYSLILTFSTTGLFTFTMVFLFINYKFFTGIRLILIAAIVPLFYVAIFSIKSQINDLGLSKAQTAKVNNIVNLLTLNFEEVDNSGRGDLVVSALDYIKNKPIAGNGVDFAVHKHVHNTYVGIWVDGGIITFLFFLVMLGVLFFKTMSLNAEVRFFGISILLVLYIFMISLQSVINQPYLIVIFVFIGYLVDHTNAGDKIDVLRENDEEQSAISNK